jgi:hypothetical protein
MGILLLNTWITNIGNGFIDKGAQACISTSLPDSSIITSSGLGESSLIQKETKYIFDKLKNDFNLISTFPSPTPTDSTLTVAELVDVDVAVLPGCILDRHLEWYENVLLELSDRDIPIVLLGAGGKSYSQRTRNLVRKKLRQLNIVGITTRDDRAYQCYSPYIEHAYRGIDCAFFIDDWFVPRSANQKFTAATFDHRPEPELPESDRIIRPNHRPLMPAQSGLIPTTLKTVVQMYRKRSLSLFTNSDNFISDSLKDYLFIYKNAEKTYADRIHACVPSLVYGNSARFYHDTPRVGLFENLTDGNITTELVELDREAVEEHKAEQIEQFSTIVSETV